MKDNKKVIIVVVAVMLVIFAGILLGYYFIINSKDNQNNSSGNTNDNVQQNIQTTKILLSDEGETHKFLNLNLKFIGSKIDGGYEYYVELTLNDKIVECELFSKNNLRMIWSSSMAAEFEINYINGYYILISSIAKQNDGDYVLIIDDKGNAVREFEDVGFTIKDSGESFIVDDCLTNAMDETCSSIEYFLSKDGIVPTKSSFVKADGVMQQLNWFSYFMAFNFDATQGDVLENPLNRLSFMRYIDLGVEAKYTDYNCIANSGYLEYEEVSKMYYKVFGEEFNINEYLMIENTPFATVKTVVDKTDSCLENSQRTACDPNNLDECYYFIESIILSYYEFQYNVISAEENLIIGNYTFVSRLGESLPSYSGEYEIHYEEKEGNYYFKKININSVEELY